MRYAIYHAPSPSHPLWLAASSWLGRDCASGKTWAHQAAEGFTASRLEKLTADPRRYGFHATLKAPFVLAEGTREDDLLDAFDRFCAGRPVVDPGTLVIGRLGPFFALVPEGPCPDLDALANDAVMAFDPFRATLTEADIARRKPDELTASQRANLMRWGYPYVFEDFRFHMTLTGPVPAAEQEAMARLLAERFSDFHRKPYRIDHLALFREREPGGDFDLVASRPMAIQPLEESA